MLQPKRTKFRKQRKGTNTGLALTGNKVSFGEWGLKTTEPGRITARQIEAARRVITRYIKRGGKVWIRIGSGKGNVEYWVAKVQPGKVLYEMEGVDETTAREAFRLAAAKLPVKTTFVNRTIM
jgi:large subunit ribosomal protein L16